MPPHSFNKSCICTTESFPKTGKAAWSLIILTTCWVWPLLLLMISIEVMAPGPQLSWHHPLVGDWCLPWQHSFRGTHIVWLCGILWSLYVASLTQGDHLHCFVPQFPHGKSIRLESALGSCWRLHWINTFKTLNIVSPDADSMPQFVK